MPSESFSYSPFPRALHLLQGSLLLSFLGPTFGQTTSLDPKDLRCRLLIGITYYELLAGFVGLMLVTRFFLVARLLSLELGDADVMRAIQSFSLALLFFFGIVVSLSAFTFVYLHSLSRPLEEKQADWRRKALIVIAWLRVVFAFFKSPMQREWWLPSYTWQEE